MRTALVLHNPGCGRSDDVHAAREVLAARHAMRWIETTSDDDARRVARAAATEVDLVIAAGGDGTVSAVAAGVVESGGAAVLGVLPVGTANDFARTLAIPESPEVAAALFSEGEVRRIDVVRVVDDLGSRLMVNLASGGAAAETTHGLDPTTKERWGAFCYVRGAVDVLRDVSGGRVTLDFEDGRESLDALLVVVGNGRASAGGVASAPRANPEDGLLEVVAIRDAPPIDVAAVAARYLFADYLESDSVVYRRARRLTVHFDEPAGFSVDGEYRGPTSEATFSVRPAALPVVVGSDYRAEGVG